MSCDQGNKQKPGENKTILPQNLTLKQTLVLSGVRIRSNKFLPGWEMAAQT